MTKKQFRARLRLLIVLTLLLAALTSYAVGKYVQDKDISAKVTFKASLASDVILQEHKAVRQSDGSYTLSDEVVTSNTYYLIPGLDIPKDPHIIIIGKTPIPAYLFVEVVETDKNAAIIYSLSSSWQETNMKAAQHGGKVYVYVSNEKPAEITTDQTIYIINNNQITVGQTLLTGAKTGTIEFYAYLVEAASFSAS